MNYIILLLLIFFSPIKSSTCTVSNSSKVDCGYTGVTQSDCENKGCCWVPEGSGSEVPWCFFPEGAGSCFLLNNDTSTPPFSDSEISIMKGLFLKNINIDGKGGVAASPSRKDPDYYYHWERDGALSMKSLMELSVSLSEYESYMKQYVQWVLGRQADSCPFSDVRINPKYYLPSGGVYKDGWCRPQTDGPGLRSIALLQFANALLSSGGGGSSMSYIKEYLWTGDSSTLNGGAIAYDLDWVASSWGSNGCDLWEEIQSSDFFWNRMAFKKALVLGSAFARTMGDAKRAETYASAASAIGATLEAHFVGGYVYESTNRKPDGAVILAFNHGYSAEDGMFAPSSKEVSATIAAFNQIFCDIYPINQKDTANGLPGVLYGRYPTDVYEGGNPWILISAALAQLFYRGAEEVLHNNQLPQHMDHWNTILTQTHKQPIQFAQSLLAAGDSVLNRIKYHVKGAGFHLSEQLDKESGEEKGAVDLTWSYAEVLIAMVKRQKAIKAFKEL